MADNVTVDNGDLSDYSVSTDDAGADGQVQRVKIAYAADGSATHVPADANGLLVNLGANNDVTVTGTVTATDGGSTLSIDDGGASLTVDGTVAVSGTVAVTQSGVWDEVGINDSGNSITVDDGGGSLTVDGTVGVSGTVTVDSELPAAVALADNAGNPTAPAVGAFGMVWDGSTWDRAPGTSADGALVNLGANNDVVISDGGGSITVDGSVSVSALPASTNTLEVVGDAAHDAAAAGNPVLEGGYASAAAPADVSADGDAVRGWRLRNGAAATVITAAGALIPGDAANGLDVDVTRLPALPAGTNNIGDVDVLTVPAPLSTTGGGTEATALRVTVATDSTGVLSVDDNGGSLTVDGTVAVSALPASTNTLEVVGDAAHDAAASGNPVLIGAEFDDAATDGVDEGDVGRLRISANRNLYSTIRDAAGNERGANVNASNQLSVSVDNTVTVASHAVTNAGTFATQESGAALTALQLLDDAIVADDAAFTVATTKTSVAGFLADETSTDSVDEGDAGAARMTLDRKLISVNQPHTAGGCSIFRSLDLDESEEEVKASAGCVYGYYIANLATSTRFVKFYNATAASVTVGSTTPVMTLPIPGNSTDDVGANLLGGVGITFDTAITVAATTGIADSDTGAPGANEVVINLFYK